MEEKEVVVKPVEQKATLTEEETKQAIRNSKLNHQIDELKNSTAGFNNQVNTILTMIDSSIHSGMVNVA